TQPLPAHAERPISQTFLLHSLSRLAPEGFDHRNLLSDDVRLLVPLTIFDQIRQQRMEPVYRDEILGEIEGGAEIVHTHVDMIVIFEVPTVLFVWIDQAHEW